MRCRPTRSVVASMITSLSLGCAFAEAEPEPELEPEPIPASSLVSGLILRDAESLTPDDHLVEIQAHGDHLYLANTYSGLGVMRLDEDGGLTTTDPGTQDGLRHCTCVAIHGPSETLYCGADGPDGDEVAASVQIYDISTPGRASWTGSFALQRSGVRDVEVVGDQLILNHFDAGLWTAQIDGQGQLSALRDAGVEGNVRFSVAVGGALVSLFADVAGLGAELRAHELDGWIELDRLALRGPPLGLSAAADGGARVAVGLGSGGMAVVTLADGQLELEQLLEPPGVVTAGLVSGQTAVAVTLSGAFAWELDDPGRPRMFGFGASGRCGGERAGNMVHGVLHEGELLVSDWLCASRWALDAGGEVVELDVPRGVHVRPEGPVRWRMRNPGPIELRAELWFDRERRWSAELGPGQDQAVELSTQLRAELLGADEPSTQLAVRVYDPAVPSEGEPLSSAAVVIVQREADTAMPPATGDMFPTLALASLEHEPQALPAPGGSQTIWFSPGCALMWAQLEDLAWIEREGWELGRGRPIMLTEDEVGASGFVRRWALEDASFGLWGEAAPELGAANEHLSDDDLYWAFYIDEMPGDAMPTDYVLDEAGVVTSIERMYRGPWTLVEPWPWD